MSTFIPKHPNTFQGNQVIINSDRLVFNAKKDSILLYSDKAIGFSTKGNFHFDTDNSEDTKFIINAPNIYLGLKSLTTGELATEPAVLGHISYIVTEPGTATGMNADNYTCLEEFDILVGHVRDNIDSILSQKTKLV